MGLTRGSDHVGRRGSLDPRVKPEDDGGGWREPFLSPKNTKTAPAFTGAVLNLEPEVSDFRLVLDDLADEAVIDGFFCAEPVVAVDVLGDLFFRLAGGL